MKIVTQVDPHRGHFNLPIRARSTGILRLALSALLAAGTCFCVKAHADPLQICSGQVAELGCVVRIDSGEFVTLSTSATITYSETAVTNTVNDYSTTLIGLLNGTPVYSMTFLAPFSDPLLTAAITTADGILSGDGASFGSPSLFSSTSVFQGSVVTQPLTYTCASAEATGSTYLTGSTVAGTTNFGPETFSAGDCESGTLAILANQEDTDADTNNQYNIPVQAITTNTYFTSQTYEIAGTTNTAPAQTPEPASLELALTGLGAIGWLRRRQIRTPHNGRRQLTTLLVLFAVASTCVCVKAHADPLPVCTTQVASLTCVGTVPGELNNFLSESTSATITYSGSSTTNTVNDYSTTLIGLLNGTPVYSMTFLAPFSDPSLTSAIATADGILSGDGASFGGPTLFSSTSLLESSMVTPALTYTCTSAEATGSTYLTGSTTVISKPSGPGTFSTGDCDTGTFTLLAGQIDTDVDFDNQYTIPVQAITTNTYLTSQTYEIAGTTNTVPAQTPEPASLELALTGLGAIGWLRRRRIKR